VQVSVTQEEADRLLCGLLASLFPNGDALRHFLLHTPGYAVVADFVRLQESRANLAMETVVELKRQGLIKESLFAGLVLAFPSRAKDIIDVAAKTGTDTPTILGLALSQLPERPSSEPVKAPPAPPVPAPRPSVVWIALAAVLALGAGTGIGYGLRGGSTDETRPGPSFDARTRCKDRYELFLYEFNEAYSPEVGEKFLKTMQSTVNKMQRDCAGILDAES
jgi:hypothetical protein